MRVLLDENLPHDLIAELIGHEVMTVQGVGWSGVKNGDLLRRAAGNIDAFVTMDRKLERQHDLTVLPFGVIILLADQIACNTSGRSCLGSWRRCNRSFPAESNMLVIATWTRRRATDDTP